MVDSPRKILLVDDDAGIRTSLARILRICGDEVRVAKDGFEALQISHDFVPDLLVADICMPGIDGVETYRRLHEQHPAMLAIFMTAYSSSEQNLEAIDHRPLSVVSKPLDIDHLIALVGSRR